MSNTKDVVFKTFNASKQISFMNYKLLVGAELAQSGKRMCSLSR